MTAPNPVYGHYAIVDNEDGTASLRMFTTPKALKEFEDATEDYLILGQGKLRQNDFKTLADVRAEQEANKVTYYDIAPYWPFPVA